MNLQRGITLLEVMVVAVIFAIITSGALTALVAGINYDQHLRDARANELGAYDFENRLRTLLKSATLSPTASDADSFFIGSEGPIEGSEVGASANTLTFSAVGRRLPYAITDVTSDKDFETLNQEQGPQGGVMEVSLSTTPIGDAGSRQGLFLRQQIPADGDPAQGGNEQLLEPNVETLRFEFWDGSEWVETWDTRSMGTKRLPAAIRVTYTITGQPERTLTVSVPTSDVTTEHPIEEETGA